MYKCNMGETTKKKMVFIINCDSNFIKFQMSIQTLKVLIQRSLESYIRKKKNNFILIWFLRKIKRSINGHMFNYFNRLKRLI